MKNKAKLSESLEDYLETILDLQNMNKVARSKDIAEKMGIKRGSVTGMLKNLAQKKLIDYEPYGFITLTGKGKNIAEKIRRRHAVIEDFLSRFLQIENEKANTAACRMEHAMDDSMVNELSIFVSFMDNCPGMEKYLARFFKKECIIYRPDKQDCKSCIEN